MKNLIAEIQKHKSTQSTPPFATRHVCCLVGIASRLPYLKELGVGTVWLSPFYKSPMVDFGYDVSDYIQVDPLFGTLEDFDDMVKEAHRLGTLNNFT